MSIQAECREAMNRLASRGVTFTERDVVEAASMPNWTRLQFIKAQRAAYAVLQGDYRKGRLARFGPVQINGSPDYVRNESKILYASAAKGPGLVETPNGIFHRMLAENDGISSVGRRPGISRDDFTAWDQQGAHEAPRESEDRQPLAQYDDRMLERLVDLLTPKLEERLSLTAKTK
jgi:hypothetical protein